MGYFNDAIYSDLHLITLYYCDLFECLTKTKRSLDHRLFCRHRVSRLAAFADAVSTSCSGIALNSDTKLTENTVKKLVRPSTNNKHPTGATLHENNKCFDVYKEIKYETLEHNRLDKRLKGILFNSLVYRLVCTVYRCGAVCVKLKKNLCLDFWHRNKNTRPTSQPQKTHNIFSLKSDHMLRIGPTKINLQKNLVSDIWEKLNATQGTSFSRLFFLDRTELIECWNTSACLLHKSRITNIFGECKENAQKFATHHARA